jgi:hypothetical protein
MDHRPNGQHRRAKLYRKEPYSGPGSSAEWVTEANAANTCGNGIGPAPGFPGSAVCTIASYSNSSGGQPGVSFDDLAYSGNVTDIGEITMVQNGVQVSTPSGLGSNGLSDGFTVSYTGDEGSNLIGPLRTGQAADKSRGAVQVDIGLGTLPWTLCTWPHFAKAFCPLSPAKQHPVAYPGEIVRVLGPWALAFEDPPGVHGHGDDAGGWNPDDGVIVFQPDAHDPHNLFSGLAYEANCTLPAAEHAWCTAVLDDALKEAGFRT